MPVAFNLRALRNATFRFTRDLTAFAEIYDISAATVRMQARLSPYAADPPAYQWVSGATSGGQAAFDPATNLCVFAAPESDMATMPERLDYDCRLELGNGSCIVLFEGKIHWTAGITRLPGDAQSLLGVSGIGDTVTVDGETVASPVPLPLALSAALAATKSAQASAALQANNASASAKAAAAAAAAANSAVSEALAPGSLAVALVALLQSLPTAPISANPSLWSNNGIPTYS
jgi:hypothetical protein